jgi:acyl-CoA synthetase (AMP-forming)/AMP-acid ligase II
MFVLVAAREKRLDREEALSSASRITTTENAARSSTEVREETFGVACPRPPICSPEHEDMTATPDTLIGHLQHQAERRPAALYSRYLFADRAPVETTYAQALKRTRQFASLYAKHGVAKGSVVLVILDHHEDLMPAFLGAMWLGAIPAFLPSLTAKLDPDRYHRNLVDLMESTEPRAILAYAELRDALARTLPERGRPALLVHTEADAEPEHPAAAPHVAEDLACIQYSSGSTGRQKGAALSHRAVLAEMAGVGEFFAMTERDSFLTWLPLYHDWGLVCVALHSIVLGTNYTLLSPMHWIAKPVVAWEAVHAYRPTIYYHPNFAYNYMAQRIKASEMKGIDLSSVRLVCNGAEPCFYDSHRMFLEKFVAYGLPPGCLGIVYGMAEVTNSVFGAGRDEPIEVDPIDRERLQTEHRAVPVAADAPNVLRMLGVGRSLRDTAWKILDDRRQELPERHVGEVAIRSRAAMHGYYRNPEATARAMHEGWYLSGDLGYRVGDKLFVTGRKSDLVIIGGVNIYPHDVENIAAEHPAVIAGRVAAIGVDDAALGTQRLIVVVESRATDPDVLREIEEHVRSQVPVRLGVNVDRVYHAPYRWLIKTSSGKIARIPNYKRLGELDGARAGT